jgi:hypothetical protein
VDETGPNSGDYASPLIDAATRAIARSRTTVAAAIAVIAPLLLIACTIRSSVDVPFFVYRLCLGRPTLRLRSRRGRPHVSDETEIDDRCETTLQGTHSGPRRFTFAPLSIVIHPSRVVRTPNLIPCNNVEQSIELSISACVHTQTLVLAARTRHRSCRTAHRKGIRVSAVPEVTGVSSDSRSHNRRHPHELRELP